MKKFFIILSIAFLFASVFFYLQFTEELKNFPSPKSCFTTQLYKINLCPKNSNYTRYSELPEHLIDALVMSEDASFFSHQGMDWFEIKESFQKNILKGRIARGGSTITQQLAKNLYLSKSKNIIRKIKEMIIAKKLEKELSKKQILEKYFNVVEFGQNLFGIQEAVRFYFRKNVRDLNPLESIFLISLLPSPKKLGKSFRQEKLSENNLWRMKTILRRLYKSKKITDSSYVYLGVLLDQHDWPFPHHSYNFEQEKKPSVSEELEAELQSIDEEDDQEAEQEFID